MRARAVVLAVVIAMAPLGARAADLVVWWDKAFYPEEEQALAELTRAFEAQTDLKIEFVRWEEWQTPDKIEAAIAAGQPPDFLFELTTPTEGQLERWVAEDRLVDLLDTIGDQTDLFDQDVLNLSMLVNPRTGRRGLYALPIGRDTNHIHVWLSLLEKAGFRREDIPAEWEPFWAFWCEAVQPAVRKVLGRQDVWAVGAPMSAGVNDTKRFAAQFVYAYTEAWPTSAGPTLLHDTAARTALVKGLAGYTELWRKGCTPPDVLGWTNRGNNEAFLAQRVVMTANGSLSIPNQLKGHMDDHHRNVITVGWPKDAFGQPEHISGQYYLAMVFKGGGHTEAAKQLVRFLVEDGWLETFLTRAGDRILPPSKRMLEQPFWLDLHNPHRLLSAVQALSQPHVWSPYGLNREQAARIEHEGLIFDLSTVVHRIVTDGISPEQAVDEAIARIKQILSEK